MLFNILDSVTLIFFHLFHLNVLAFTLEDELPDYDLDADDEAFLGSLNKTRNKVCCSLATLS